MSVTIYVLLLEGEHIYVGKTTDMDKIYEEHVAGKGSPWTEKFKPIRILKIIPNSSVYDEDRYVKEYMTLYGIRKVRGGVYTDMIFPKNITHLERELQYVKNLCINCGEKGHSADTCLEKDCLRCNRNTHSTLRCYETTTLDGDPIKDHKSIITCGICSSEFRTQKSFDNHLLRCYVPGESVQGEQPKAPIIQCNFCPQTFVSAEWYKAHQLKCGPGATYKCDICHVEFKSLKWFQEHKATCQVAPSRCAIS